MKRTMTKKTMFALVIAVLGIAIGATALVPSAQASKTFLYQPCDCTG
jgi:hypothetical protein